MASTTVCRLSEGEAAAMSTRSVTRSQIFFGFDLSQNGDIMVKGYLVPLLRSHISHRSSFDLIRNALIDNDLDCRALEGVRQYVQGEAYGTDGGLSESARPEAIILSTDAIAETQAARLKSVSCVHKCFTTLFTATTDSDFHFLYTGSTSDFRRHLLKR
jgi:hypothetical protein